MIARFSVVSVVFILFAMMGFRELNAEEIKADDIMLLCHFEENADSEIGQKGIAPDYIKYVDGKFGKGVLISQLITLDYRQGESPISLEKGALEFWVNSQSDTDNNKEENYHTFINVKGIRFYLRYQNNMLVFGGYDGSSYKTVKSLPLNWKKGDWHHVAAVWNSENGYRLFVDGNLADSYDDAFKPSKLTDDLHIGYWPGTGMFADAIIDELIVYNRPLSFPEIQAAYKRMKPLLMKNTEGSK